MSTDYLDRIDDPTDLNQACEQAASAMSNAYLKSTAVKPASTLKAGDLVMFTVDILGFVGKRHKDEKGVIKEIIGDMCHIQAGPSNYVRHISAVKPMEGQSS